MGTTYDYSYSDCLRRSQRANWDIDDFNDFVLDFDRPFLPEELAQVTRLEALTSAEQLLLNQIRGYSYACIFRFVEQYIIELVGELSADHTDPVARQALELFRWEEQKHQAMFSLFEDRFIEGFGTECEVIGDLDRVTAGILAGSRPAVLMLTTMLEWLTQAHYLAYFNGRSDEGQVDDAFAELFRLHWVEEAQHARLDTLETIQAVEPLDADERHLAVEEFLGLCSSLRDLVTAQAALDVASLERARGASYRSEDRLRIVDGQEQAMVHTFIGLGLRTRHFRRLVDHIHPRGEVLVDGYLEQVS